MTYVPKETMRYYQRRRRQLIKQGDWQVNHNVEKELYIKPKLDETSTYMSLLSKNQEAMKRYKIIKVLFRKEQ